VVLLLESIESPVDLVEVAQHLVSQLGELLVHRGEPPVDLAELARQELDELLALR
jgi:hypothetical protein